MPPSISDELPADRGHLRLCKMRAVWVCPRGWIDRSSVPDLWGCHSDLSALSSKKLFQHLTSKNSKGPGDGGQPAPGDYHIYPGVREHWWRAYSGTNTHGEPKVRRHRLVIKREKRRNTAEAEHLMMLLECVTELSYVNRWLMRHSNWNGRKVERQRGGRRQIKEYIRTAEIKEDTLSIKTGRVSRWLITSLLDTNSAE